MQPTGRSMSTHFTPPPGFPTGTSGSDNLIGTDGADQIDLLGGNDTYEARGGNDTVLGNSGDDRLFGEAGNDSLFGGSGNDWLDGGSGNDTLEGGLGNDDYIVTSTDDVVRGEIGFSLGGGIDTVRSTVDYLMGQNLEILRLLGSLDIDGTGNDGPGTLVGNAGNNVLSGRGGNDQINGNEGDDRLIGGVGRDTLVGGAGADTFIYTAIADSRAGPDERDFINGFTHGQDKIDVSTMDASPFYSGIQDWTFIGTAAFGGGGIPDAGQLRYFTFGGGNHCILEGDLQGDGVADFQVFVNLTNYLTGTDFIF